MMATQMQALSPRAQLPAGFQGMAQAAAQAAAAAAAAGMQASNIAHQQPAHHGHMPPPFPFSAAAMAHMIAG